jgi:hypothetical protein
MKQVSCLSNTELWYPYSEPRVTRDDQEIAEGTDCFANYFADRQNPSRLDGLVLGS